MKVFLASISAASALINDIKPFVPNRAPTPRGGKTSVFSRKQHAGPDPIDEMFSRDDFDGPNSHSKKVARSQVGQFVSSTNTTLADQMAAFSAAQEQQRAAEEAEKMGKDGKAKKDKTQWWKDMNKQLGNEVTPAGQKIFVDEDPKLKNDPFYHQPLGRPGSHNRLKFYSGFTEQRNRTQEKLMMKVFNAFDYVYVVCVDCLAVEKQIRDEQWPFVNKLALWDGKKNDIRHRNETMLAHRVWWTHVDIWRHAHANNYSRVLIMEEDAIFTPFNVGMTDAEARNVFKFVKHDEDWHLLRFAYNPHKVNGITHKCSSGCEFHSPPAGNPLMRSTSYACDTVSWAAYGIRPQRMLAQALHMSKIDRSQYFLTHLTKALFKIWIMLDRWMPLMNKQTFMTPPWMWQESVDKRPFLGGALEGESKIFNHVKNYNSFQSFCSVPDDKAIAEEKPLHNYGAQGLNIVQHASNNEVPIVAGSNAVVARAPVLNFPTTYNHADAVGRLYTNGFRLKHRKQSSKKHHHKGKN